jgi:hypothetical protein
MENIHSEFRFSRIQEGTLSLCWALLAVGLEVLLGIFVRTCEGPVFNSSHNCSVSYVAREEVC